MIPPKNKRRGEIRLYDRYGDLVKSINYIGKMDRKKKLNQITKMYGQGTYYISIIPTINLKDDEFED